jgi:hypothetical protein
MADLGETVLVGYLCRPGLNVRAVNFNRPSATTAHDVVMVLQRAPSVARFAIVGSDDVHLTGLVQGLQGSVDSREPNGGAVGPQFGVDVLRAAELVELVE